MPFGDWDGDGDVSFGEAMGTGMLLGGIASGPGPEHEPDPGGGDVGCGSCLAFGVAGVVLLLVCARLIACVMTGS